MTFEGSREAVRGRRLASVGVLGLILYGCGGDGGTAKPAAPASCAGAIPASKAWDHRLEDVTVRGVVIRTLPQSPLYDGATLDLAETPASQTDVTVIIPAEDRGNFPTPVGFYLGKTICAAGLIGGYQPTNMVVSSPEQIAIAP